MKIEIHHNINKYQKALEDFKDDIPNSIRNVLKSNALYAHNIASELLSGHQEGKSGEYPVPVRTGNLRRSLNYMTPNTTRTFGSSTLKTEANEIALVNSALYAHVVHEGEGTQTKYGRRPFMEDALRELALNIPKKITTSLKRQAKKRGLA